MMSGGRLIVIEGLDGSGKATQARLLADTLAEQGRNVRKIAFPDYESDSSALVRMYLGGAFGTDPNAVNPYAASSFFAVDRFASYTRSWKQFYTDGGIVIADRYTASNAIHQCAKLPEAQWDDFINWLFHYEYQLLGIPAPDTTIYLRVDPEVSQRLMTARYAGNEARKDIHEADTAYLRKARRAADYCREKLGWTTIECVQNGVMRTIGEIAAEIIGALELS